MGTENETGKRIYDLAGKMFPITRSITGDGVRQTLKILDNYISEGTGRHFELTEVPSGTQVFDWTVPKEWKIRAAYIENEKGERIIDMEKCNLHVLGYSLPVDKWVSLDELKEHVYTQADQPDLIPYVTSYYKERWGFCMSKNQLDSLPDGKYHTVVDSELFDGSLTYAECVIPGKSDRELLITSYTCHPSMANNECSGPALLAELIRYVDSLPDRKYTYRFVLNPETIGSITYLSRNYKKLQEKTDAGIVLSCVGDDREYSIIRSRYGNTLADRSLEGVLKDLPDHKTYSFLERGSDERQYNAPGIDLPVVGFCRSKYGMYPEYHTSADDMSLVSPEGFEGSYRLMTGWINAMEHNEKYLIKVLCEPQLGKRGLYPTVSKKGSYDEVAAMRHFIAYADGRNDLFEISELTGAPIEKLIEVTDTLKDSGLIEW